MKLKSLLLVCFLWLFAVPVFAQSSGVASDPVSGIWTGDMGPSEAERYPLTMELKFDGQSVVSGAITGTPRPAEIRAGRFDPKNGALKLEVDVKSDGGISRWVFDGTAVKDLATGRVSSDTDAGNFKITKKVAGDSLPAQQTGVNDTAATLRKGFGEVSGWVTKAADLVPADKYSYQPAPTVRTFGQQLAHIADSYNYYCARAAGQNVQWSEAIEKGSTDKATLAQNSTRQPMLATQRMAATAKPVR